MHEHDTAPASAPDRPITALVVMGVSGCGKSTVGLACAQALGWRFLDGDDWHSPEAIARMRAGIALSDADRAGWLDRLASLLAPSAEAASTGMVLACSALRLAYRDRLRAARPGLGFVYLRLTQEQALRRVAARAGHFFPPSLVADQFATLEPPEGEPRTFIFDAGGSLTPSEIAAAIAAAVGPAASASHPTHKED